MPNSVKIADSVLNRDLVFQKKFSAKLKISASKSTTLTSCKSLQKIL